MEKYTPEQKEKPNGVNLRIVGPHGDKHCMVGFDAKTREQAGAYNEALNHHLGTLKKTIFHQVGKGNDVGYHAWEIWDDKIDAVKLEALLQEIEADAQIIMTEEDFGELDKKVYQKWDKQKTK